MKKILIILVFVGVRTAVSAAQVSHDKVVIVFDDGSQVRLAVSNGQTRATYRDASHPAKQVHVDRTLNEIVMRSSELAYLMNDEDDGKHVALIVASQPSLSTGGMAYCGAGQEDYIVLIEKAGDTIEFKDKVLLQSCLQSKELASDDPDHLATGVSIEKTERMLSYRLLDDAMDTRRLLYIKHGKIVSDQSRRLKHIPH